MVCKPENLIAKAEPHIVNHPVSLWPEVIVDIIDELFQLGIPFFIRSFQIGEAFAGDALDRTFGALCIGDVKRGTVGIPEIEFGQISMKMLASAMLVDALHAAFEDAEKALDGLSMNAPVAALYVSRERAMRLSGVLPWCRSTAARTSAFSPLADELEGWLVRRKVAISRSRAIAAARNYPISLGHEPRPSRREQSVVGSPTTIGPGW